MSRVRVVDQLVLHGEPVSFRDLAAQVVTPTTRYLVLDLDKTVHLGRNMGELLGWELGARAAYGEPYLERVRTRRGMSRFVFDWSRPRAVAHYLVRGARRWAYPGLLYLATVKIGTRSETLRRWLYLRYGVDPVEAIQRIPRVALFHQLAELPVDTLRRLAADVWERYRDDQVITREDIAWLRERFPALTIVISSASPQPVLEVAARELGVHEVVYSSIEEHEGYLSAPSLVSRLFLLPRLPRRIAPPSGVRDNAGRAKIRWLLERHPDFCDVETVGITDTGYGEDHSWTGHFTRLVDINSPAPFAPIVASESPLREIHSAQVLTRGELERRRQGEPCYLDPRRKGLRTGRARTLGRDELATLLGQALAAAETLAEAYQREAGALGEAMRDLDTSLREVAAAIERTVREYNLASGRERRRVMIRLRRQLRRLGSARREAVRRERPVALLVHALTSALARARASLEEPSPSPSR